MKGVCLLSSRFRVKPEKSEMAKATEMKEKLIWRL